MNTKVNRDECIGCGVCAQICPEVFERDEDAGKAKVSPDTVGIPKP